MLAKEQLCILQYLPPGSETLRLDILRRLEQGLARRSNNINPHIDADGNAINQDGNRAQDAAQGGQDSSINERTPLWEVLGKKYLDIVIDAGKM
jgi:hypothetical protein